MKLLNSGRSLICRGASLWISEIRASLLLDLISLELIFCFRTCPILFRSSFSSSSCRRNLSFLWESWWKKSPKFPLSCPCCQGMFFNNSLPLFGFDESWVAFSFSVILFQWFRDKVVSLKFTTDTCESLLNGVPDFLVSVGQLNNKKTLTHVARVSGFKASLILRI